MSILITGARGFLGGAISKKLAKLGQPIHAIIRNEAPHLSELGITIHKGDLCDKTFVESALQGIDAVIHCAAKPGIWGDYKQYYADNVTATENIINACKNNNVKKIVFTSSPSVVFHMKDQNGCNESEPYPLKYESPYPATKAIAEQKILGANSPSLATVALRPHLMWGPGDTQLIPRIIKRAKANRMFLINHGTNIIDTLYIDNAVDAHLLALEKLAPGSPIGGKAYFITNGEPMMFKDIINSILAQLDIPPITKNIPRWLAYIAGALTEAFYSLTGKKNEPELTRFVSCEMACSHWFDISAARKDLDYSPKVTMEQGFQKLGEWLKKSQNI